MSRPDRFFFVSGCARSGTTVMATLLNWSDEVLVTQERFAPLLRFKPDAFLPDLFAEERMLDFRMLDDQLCECGYSDFTAQPEYSAEYANPKDFSAISTYPIRGDKITHLYRAVDRFKEQAWEECEILLLHMIRGLDHVVSSYETRRLDPTDNWKLGYDTAIIDWTTSVEEILRFSQAPPSNAKVGIVEYESIFGGGLQQASDAVARVYAFAGLAFGDKQAEGVARVHEASTHFERTRTLHEHAVAKSRSAISSDTMDKYKKLRELRL